MALRKVQKPSPDGASIAQAKEVSKRIQAMINKGVAMEAHLQIRVQLEDRWLSSVVTGSEASAESALMSDFTRWSRWFECGLDLQHEKRNALGMMGWIAAHAASDGSGLEFDANVWASIEDETGLSVEQAKAAVDALIGAGLLTAVGQPSQERLVARAVI